MSRTGPVNHTPSGTTTVPPPERCTDSIAAAKDCVHFPASQVFAPKSAIDTRELVNSTLREIEEGNRIANKTADVLYGVVDSIQTIALNSKTLSENTQIQAEAVEQADQGIARISEVVQSNSAAAQESYATSEELSAQAATMHNLVAQFKFKR